MSEKDIQKKFAEHDQLISRLIIHNDILTRQVDYLLDIKNGKRLIKNERL